MIHLSGTQALERDSHAAEGRAEPTQSKCDSSKKKEKLKSLITSLGLKEKKYNPPCLRKYILLIGVLQL